MDSYSYKVQAFALAQLIRSQISLFRALLVRRGFQKIYKINISIILSIEVIF